MINLRLQADGLNHVLSHFDVVANNVTRVIEETAKEGAKLVQRRARELAPKKSGKLRRSIRIRRGKRGITQLVRPRSFMAHFQEYGTQKGVPAKWFMKKAREEILPEVERQILAKVEEEIRR
jgi:HK97 gp10 family phage protein